MYILTHDALCKVLKCQNSYDIFIDYFSKYHFEPIILLPTYDKKDEFGDISFLNLLLLNKYEISTQEIINIIEFFLTKELNLFEIIPNTTHFHGSTALELVICYGDLTLLQYFLENTEWKDEINNLQSQAMKEIFIFAAMYGNVEKIEYLVKKLSLEQVYFYSENEGNSALMAAVKSDKWDNFKYLYDNFNYELNRLNKNNLNILLYATQSMDDKFIGFLLEQEIFDINFCDTNGNSILFYAINNTYSDMPYHYLMSHYTFDFNYTNQEQEDIMQIVIKANKGGIFNHLLTHFSEQIDFKKTYYGKSEFNLLMGICHSFTPESIQLLLAQEHFNVEHNTLKTKENNNQRTNAFLQAAKGKNYTVLKFFLNNGYFIDVDNLQKAEKIVKILHKDEINNNKKLKKCLDIIKPYLVIALEKEQLEHNVLNVNDKKQSINNKI